MFLYKFFSIKKFYDSLKIVIDKIILVLEKLSPEKLSPLPETFN